MNPLSLAHKLFAGGALLVILILGIMLADARGDARAERKRADSEHEARVILIEKYRAAAVLAKANAEGWARGIEQQRAFVTKEVSREYQVQLGDLRRRYDAFRLRAGQAGTDRGLSGGANLPGVPDGAGRADGASGAAGPPSILVTPEKALAAETYRLQLIALQDWVRKQAAVAP